MTQAIPPGFHSVTPHLIVRGAADAIAFYAKAFGAVELRRQATPDGARLIHALIQIGDSYVMLVDEFPEWGSVGPETLGGCPLKLNLYVPDTDAAYARAVDAGCEGTMAPRDMFWGDRYASVVDPFGYAWDLATHQRDPSPEELAAAAQGMFGGAS